jgi:hypothetical protein
MITSKLCEVDVMLLIYMFPQLFIIDVVSFVCKHLKPGCSVGQINKELIQVLVIYHVFRQLKGFNPVSGTYNTSITCYARKYFPSKSSHIFMIHVPIQIHMLNLASVLVWCIFIFWVPLLMVSTVSVNI